jgi:hypothetical protein
LYISYHGFLSYSSGYQTSHMSRRPVRIWRDFDLRMLGSTMR